MLASSDYFDGELDIRVMVKLRKCDGTMFSGYFIVMLFALRSISYHVRDEVTGNSLGRLGSPKTLWAWSLQ
jgi:hypothetical protein